MQRHFIGFLLVIIFFLSMVTLSIAEEVDRLAKLIEGAKKEGKVVWYSSLTAVEADVVARKFREKYPFIIPEMYRTGSQNMMTRVLAEDQAKRYIFDALMTTQAESEILNRKGIFAKYLSPQRIFFPKT